MATSMTAAQGSSSHRTALQTAEPSIRAPQVDYLHLDLAGISVFDAGNDVSVPAFAPVFADMGKPVFGFHDMPNKPFDPALIAKTARFIRYEVIPYQGIEALLVAETPIEVQKRFAAAVIGRPDYPTVPPLSPSATDTEIREHVRRLLQERKGSNDGYAALLIAECANATELPDTLAKFLIAIDRDLRPTTSQPAADSQDS